MKCVVKIWLFTWTKYIYSTQLCFYYEIIFLLSPLNEHICVKPDSFTQLSNLFAIILLYIYIWNWNVLISILHLKADDLRLIIWCLLVSKCDVCDIFIINYCFVIITFIMVFYASFLFFLIAISWIYKYNTYYLNLSITFLK